MSTVVCHLLDIYTCWYNTDGQRGTLSLGWSFNFVFFDLLDRLFFHNRLARDKQMSVVVDIEFCQQLTVVYYIGSFHMNTSYCTELCIRVILESMKKADVMIHFLHTRIHRYTQKLTVSQFTQMWIISA